MLNDHIEIRGARTNNLKGVDVSIPLNEITCISGPSGSGKSSLAFHTLFKESKRRYMNSFPTYMKFFLDRPGPVDVDKIHPVLPVFGLPQFNPVIGSRSNVADVMGLTTFIQNIFFKLKSMQCPDHDLDYRLLEPWEIIESEVGEGDIIYLLVEKETFIQQFGHLPLPSRSKKTASSKVQPFDKNDQYWEILRFKRKSLPKAILKEQLSELDSYFVCTEKKSKIKKISGVKRPACPVCFLPSPSIRLENLSPYNALGACANCKGYGANLEYSLAKIIPDPSLSIEEGAVRLFEYKRFVSSYENFAQACKKNKISLKLPVLKLPKKFKTLLYEGEGDFSGLNKIFKYLERKKYKRDVRIFVRSIQEEVLCESCQGLRIKTEVHKLELKNDSTKTTLKDFFLKDVYGLSKFFEAYRKQKFEDSFSQTLVSKVSDLLILACDIGLGHLNLLRKSKTLSPGEYQRLLLLKYLSYEGTGALFVFDEPSLGLGEKEQRALLEGFSKIKKQGNTIVLVDHSDLFQKMSDFLIEVGPGAGHYGGEILYQGKPKPRPIKEKKYQETKNTSKSSWISLKGASIYGRGPIDFKIPTNRLVWCYGEAGSGKSSFLIKVMANELARKMTGLPLTDDKYIVEGIEENETINELVIVDSILNKLSSRSTVGTFTELSVPFRRHFESLPFSKKMDLNKGHFSFNSKLGQCPDCEGRGVKVIEMQFLEDVVLECENCKGKKLNPLYGKISDGKWTASNMFNAPLTSVIDGVALTPKYKRIYELLKILKLDYLALDRPLGELSGGEKQRLKLLSYLKNVTEGTLFIIENLSFGLSRNELSGLIQYLQRLCALENSIIIIDPHPILGVFSDYSLEFFHQKSPQGKKLKK